MYFADKAPEDVPRRDPTERTVVARLQGQDDIPSSPPDILTALRLAAREASVSTRQASTSNLEPQVETATSEPARTEPTSVGPASVGGQQHSDPFGEPDHLSLEPQHQPTTNISPEDAHLLDIPDSESNPNFGDLGNWNHFGNGDDLHDGLAGFNAGAGEFNYGGGGFGVNVGLGGFNHSGNGFSNWTLSQAPQPEFAMPQPDAFPPAPSSAPPNNYGFAQSAQTHSTNSSVLPPPTAMPSVGQSNNQPPYMANSLSGRPEYTVLPPPASGTNTLPVNGPHCVPSYTRATASPNPMAATSTNNNSNHNPVSTPVRNPTTALQARLRRLNNSSKKVSSKTPQRKHMKANVAAHYAVKRARQQRSRRGRRQTPQDVEPSENEPSQSGSTSAAAPAIASIPDGLTPAQSAVGLPMRKYIGFHILTRAAWPMDQPTLLTSALAYALSRPVLIRGSWLKEWSFWSYTASARS
ncbi:hypothetical protein FS749_006309 [Ceratobasidium sp. UAMH 11750]|nr:hypothetical protein FS749_006309 [Ceratobasidium sp. UAMH 11750]